MSRRRDCAAERPLLARDAPIVGHARVATTAAKWKSNLALLKGPLKSDCGLSVFLSHERVTRLKPAP